MGHTPVSNRFVDRLLWALVLAGIIVVCPLCQAAPQPNVAVTDMDIEDLMKLQVDRVYGASKFDQKVTEAPASVSIITSSDIKQYGWRTLGEALRSVKGFYISNDRNYSYLGSRGFLRPGDYNSRFLLVVDGHQVNDNIYDTATIGDEFILDLDLIDRIEVIRGPGSSLYGSNAFLGVINITTRQASSVNGLEVSGSAGSFDTYNERITFGQKYASGLELLVSGSHTKSKGQSLYFKEFNNLTTNGGWSDGTDYGKNGSFFANLKYAGFTLEGAYISREKGIPTSSYDTVFNDSRSRTTDDRGYVDLKYEKKLGQSTIITSRAFYDYYHFDGRYFYDVPSLLINKDFSAGEMWGTELELSTQLGERHKLLMGAEYKNSFRLQQRNYNQNPYETFLDDNRSSYVLAVHFQDQISLANNLILNVGMRYDSYKTFGDAFNPRIGLIYNPFPKTTLKFLYGEAFRAPNAYELYYSDGGLSSKANPNLDPERIKTYEAILEQYFQTYRISLSGFYYQMKNIISQQIDPRDGLFIFQNIDSVEAKGFEFEVQKKWDSNVEARMSYSLQEATDTDTGRLLVNSPKHLVKLNLRLPIIENRLSAGIEVQYVGPRKTLAGNTAGGAVVSNITLLSRELLPGLEISGSIYNLFDKKYGDPASNEFRQNTITQDGRVFRAKFVYRF